MTKVILGNPKNKSSMKLLSEWLQENEGKIKVTEIKFDEEDPDMLFITYQDKGVYEEK